MSSTRHRHSYAIRLVWRAEDRSILRRKAGSSPGASERRNSCPGPAQRVEEEHAPAPRQTARLEREEERRSRARDGGAWTERIAIYKKKPAGWRAFRFYWPRFVPDGRAFLLGAADLAGFFVFAAAAGFSFFGAAFFFGFASAAASVSSPASFFGAA